MNLCVICTGHVILIVSLLTSTVVCLGNRVHG